MEKELIRGMMAGSIEASGSLAKCMGKGNLYGRMGKCMRGSMKMIRGMVMEFMFGLGIRDMKGNGRMDYDMGKVC